MTAPRLEIRLDRIRDNARSLVHRLGTRGIAVSAVTKATLGSPEVARELVGAGVSAIGDSRIENIEAMRLAGVVATMVMIRTPMLSQVDRVVGAAQVSLNTEPVVIEGLGPIEGLHTDAFTLVAEVIESKTKPTQAWGEINQTAFGRRAPLQDRGDTARTILALGRQDVDPDGLEGPAGVTILGASSDHLVVDGGHALSSPGSEMRFRPNYAALLAAMTSPFVAKVFTGASELPIQSETSSG